MNNGYLLQKRSWLMLLRAHAAKVCPEHAGDDSAGMQVAAALSSTADGSYPDIGPQEIDCAIAATDCSRDIIIRFLNGLVAGEWLWRVGHEQYILNVPQHARVAAQSNSHRRREAPQATAPAVHAPVPQGPRCALYRWYDAQHNLLYVGITNNVEVRAASHATNAIWWPFVYRQTIEWLPSRTEAETAERQTIRGERPIFNQRHNDAPDARQRIIDYLTARKRTDLLDAPEAA